MSWSTGIAIVAVDAAIAIFLGSNSKTCYTGNKKVQKRINIGQSCLLSLFETKNTLNV